MSGITNLTIEIGKQQGIYKGLTELISNTKEDLRNYNFLYFSEVNMAPRDCRIYDGKISIDIPIDTVNSVRYNFTLNETTNKFEMKVWGVNEIHVKVGADTYTKFHEVNTKVNGEWLKHLKDNDSDFINTLIDFYGRMDTLLKRKKYTEDRLKELVIERKTAEFEILYDNLKVMDKIIFTTPTVLSLSTKMYSGMFVVSDFTVWKFCDKTTRIRLHYLKGELVSHLRNGVGTGRYKRPTDNFRLVNNKILKRELLEKYIDDKFNLDAMNKQHKLVRLIDKI